jgi:hypothetical protein
MVKKILLALKYIGQVYASSFVLCVIFFFRRYSIEINHVESRHTGMDTWLTTLVPNSIVFEVENAFIHVHTIRFKKTSWFSSV